MVLSATSDSAKLPVKRTRVGVKQSKDGCFTCKTRRIKCDEERPFCQRCIRSQRICEGYRTRSTNNEQDSFAPSQVVPTEDSIPLRVLQKCFVPLKNSLYDGFRRTLEQDRLSRLGCKVLASNRYGGDIGPLKSLWNYLLPQLSHAIPAVNSAAASLGVAYELRYLSKSNDESRRLAELQHRVALQTLRQDVQCQPHGPVPLLLACVLLSCAELLERRQVNALAHIQGALKVLLNRQTYKLETSLSHTRSQGGSKSLDDTFELMFMTLDVQKASYMLAKPPDLPASSINFMKQPLDFHNVEDASSRLVPLVHLAYHFAAKASEYKYLPRVSIPSELLIEQGRCIASLLGWLKTLDHDLLAIHMAGSTVPISPEQRHARMLRAQCLSVIIYTSSVLSPYEKEYDQQSALFQQIIEDSNMARGTGLMPVDVFGEFSAGPGIMQPLFLTAMKYRHSLWRRKAIALLRGAGSEGPWEGDLLAAVASRATEVEEAGVGQGGIVEIDPEQVAEHSRLHGCLMKVEVLSENMIPVDFNRCNNVERMLLARVPWTDKSNWCLWNEDLTF